MQLGGSNNTVDLAVLEAAGVTKLILAGSDAAAGDVALTVPDPLAEATAPDVLHWAAATPPDAGQARMLIRRAVESGAHLPVLRFAAQIGRDGLEQLIDELEEQMVGGPQIPALTIADLRRCLETPAAADSAGDEDRRAEEAIAALEDGCDADALKAAAAATVAAPRAASAWACPRPRPAPVTIATCPSRRDVSVMGSR